MASSVILLRDERWRNSHTLPLNTCSYFVWLKKPTSSVLAFNLSIPSSEQYVPKIIDTQIDSVLAYCDLVDYKCYNDELAGLS